jgi:hypothetical protein
MRPDPGGRVTLIGHAFDKLDQIDHVPVTLGLVSAIQPAQLRQFVEQLRDSHRGLLDAP